MRSREYRVRVVVERRNVFQDETWSPKKRDRFVKTGVQAVASFSEDLSNEMELFDRLREIVQERDQKQAAEILKDLKI